MLAARLCALFFLLSVTLVSISSARKSPPYCNVCEGIVEKFKKGMNKTKKHNFGGGNTRWEEKKLGNYQVSEVRFLEILESMCGDDKECHSMVEEYEELLENWWFEEFAKKRDTDLHEFFCINNVKACCKPGRFGSECRPCVGGWRTPCGGRGECDGNGTRMGTGNCKCFDGYQGHVCEDCADLYWEQERNDTHTICKKCHQSCKGGCTGDGAKLCDECQDGWEHKGQAYGCVDVDECDLSKQFDPCKEKPNTYCSNTEGSHKCLGCHTSCNNCSGPGPAACNACNTGYDWLEGECKDVDECKKGAECTAEKYCLNTEGSFRCLHCDASCQNCEGPGPEKCILCRGGYTDVNGTCKDINECKQGAKCGPDEFCLNTEGSFKCEKCHEACKNCTGFGPEKCGDCQFGFERVDDHVCVDVDECLPPRPSKRRIIKEATEAKIAAEDKDKDKEKDGGLPNLVEDKATETVPEDKPWQTPCKGANERCVNTNGSYDCKCMFGFKRKDGKCMEKKGYDEEREEKKKKKKKKRKQKKDDTDYDEEVKDEL